MTDETSAVNVAFGAILKGAAREAGKSQAEIAESIGQSLTTIGRIFAGKRHVTVTQFFEIADVLGMGPADLLDRVTKRLASVSPPPVSIAEQRRKKSPADMTDDELEAIEKKAAINDDELEQDEPELP